MPTKLFVINPKDRSVIDLYGILDPVTRDWTDGLLSNIFRDINKPTDKNERKYIVYDGDVDALWVENMNSVMDDNKLLTLANGERIRLQKHCAMLFEVSLCLSNKIYQIFQKLIYIDIWNKVNMKLFSCDDLFCINCNHSIYTQVFDLQYASPATVSRCGMVYVDPKNLGYDPFWYKYVNTRQNKQERDDLNRLYDKYVNSLVDMVIEGIVDGRQGDKMKTIVPLSNLNLVRSIISKCKKE